MSQKWRFGMLSCMKNVPWYVITSAFPFMTAFEVARAVRMRAWGILGIALFKTAVILLALASYLPNLLKIDWLRERGFHDDMLLLVKRVILGVALLLIVMFLGVVLKIRMRIRKTFDIEGSLCRDFTDSCCCWVLCSLCQMRNHLFELQVKNLNFPHYSPPPPIIPEITNTSFYLSAAILTVSQAHRNKN